MAAYSGCACDVRSSFSDGRNGKQRNERKGTPETMLEYAETDAKEFLRPHMWAPCPLHSLAHLQFLSVVRKALLETLS